MNFYNFEKYNDVFCFEKLSNDYQPLLKIYEGTYKTSLNTFLKEYEENTEFRYIESQLYICNKEITIQKSIITSLERLDHETFYYVRNRVDEKHSVYAKTQKDSFEVKQQTIQTTPENPNNDDSKELKAPTVIDYPNDDDDDDDDDDEVLDMHATAKNFIKFISNRITSLCLINKFLESRLQELDQELKAVAQPGSGPEILNNENPSSIIGFSFENHFDNVHKNDVYKYFEKELLEKKYLTKEKLEEYLVFAFQNKKAPEVKFTFDKIKTQRAIIRIFYNYYCTKAQKPYGEKTAYVELLTNYFNGFDTIKIESNFSK